MSEEKKRLENIAEKTSYISGISAKTNQYAFEIVRRHINPGRILEVGAAEGALAEKLATLREPLDLLDGSAILCEKLRERFPQSRIFNSLIENFVPDAPYPNIVLSHVLEHVEDAEAVAARISGWLAPGGRLFAFVPNAMSVHRQIGVMIGALSSEDTLNEKDRSIGHRRVFNPVDFRACLNKSGLRTVHYGGYWLKPLSDSQIERDWSGELLDAFLRLGENYPDIAAEIYAVAERR